MRTLFATVLLLASCARPEVCENTEVARMTAPDGRHDAVLFKRDCGATTGFSSQVSIVRRGAKVDGGGNVLIADGDRGKAPAAAWGGPDVDLGWTAPNRLVVRHHPSARVFKSQARVADVTVVRVGDLEDRSLEPE